MAFLTNHPRRVAMAWNTPILVEITVGMEVASYASAKL